MKLAAYSISFMLLLGSLSAQADSTSGQATAGAAKDGVLSGKVTETMDAASYTYILIDTGSSKAWAAAPQFTVKVGDTVSVSAATPMPNYYSKTLKRTFEVVYFTGGVSINGATSTVAAAQVELPKGHPPTTQVELPQGHPPTDRQAAPVSFDLNGIKRAENGKTIAEIYSDKDKLTGQTVTVRGRVVKFNPMIMGKNWLHLRDGSGTEGANDLTVTTSAPSKIGSLVVITGKLYANRDFGAGYKYGLIVEDAAVVDEK